MERMAKGMDVQQQKRKRIPWGRWLIVFIVLVLVIAGSILWINENQGPWITILPIIIFTVLGVFIALFQWLFPVSSDLADHPPAPTQLPPLQPVLVTAAPLAAPSSTNIPSHVLPVAPLSEKSPPAGKSAYRSIIGIPPPTDPRTIQQREQAVSEIYTHLIQPDIAALVLTGIGGVGKSTLAALVYRHAEDERLAGRGPFSTPSLWLKVDSSAVTMADLVGTIFDALGKPLPDLSSLAPHNQAATLFNALNNSDGARLIVLDQFENLLDLQTGSVLADRPGIGEWLDAINSQPCRSRILLTSRPWPQGSLSYPPTHMQEYHVTGLQPAEGADLLRKLGIHAPEAELHVAVERCAGHAFALTLLASLLRNRHLSLATFFKDPAYAQLWTGNVARNLLDQIYTRHLNMMQRKLLLAFSVYREPVSLDAARAIADLDSGVATSQIHLALDGLLAQHLLQPAGEGIYQLHTIVISYAHDHFDLNSEQANKRALNAAHAGAARYYLQYAARHCPRRELRHQRSDVQPLIEGVWQFCQAELWREAYEVIENEDLYQDLLMWRSTVILLELYQLLLPLEKWQPAQEEHVYDELGEIYRALDRPEEARYYFELALALCKVKKNRWEEGYALNNIGRIYSNNGDKRRALEYYEEALRAHEEVKNLAGQAAVINNQGWAYDDFGDLKLSLAKYERALQLYREAKNLYGEADALNAIGRVYADLGEIDVARQYHEQALPICRELGARGIEAWTLNNLGRVREARGDLDQALAYLKQALSIRRETGNRRSEGSTLNNLGRVYSEAGQYEAAIDYLLQALTIRREVGDRPGKEKTLNSLGYCYEQIGQLEEACLYFKQALSIRQALGQKRRVARSLSNLGRCYAKLTHYRLSLACFLLAIQLFEESQALSVDDARLKQHADETHQSIDELARKLGEDDFSALLTQVEPQASRIVEEDLRVSLHV
jgi:tetratricopeptide (TPR) repeat protein